MKLFLLFFISFITSTAFTAQTPVLASVEMTSSIAPPVEKNKAKKRLRKKKHFKKPNKSAQLKNKKIRTRLFIVISILFGIALFVFLIFIVFGASGTISGFILATLITALSSISGLVLLIISIIYTILDLNREKRETSPLKKSTEELKTEVAYLNPEKVARYLALNEQLTVAKINQRNATAVLKDRVSTKKEKNKAKIDLSNLKQDIRIINQELKEFRQQNSIKQARVERG